MGDLFIFEGYTKLNTLSESVNITNDTIIKLRQHDQTLLTSIYREHFPMVKKYIIDNSGNESDAQDVFQDGIYLLIRKCESDDFELTAKLSTFLYGICRNLWLKQLEKDKRKTEMHEKASFEFQEETKAEVDLTEEHLSRVKLIREGIQALGEPCNTILEHFYFLKSSMKEIAEKLHYSNPNHAKNQKYKCFMRLKKMVTSTWDKR